jgi:hypothetical protein
VRIFVLKKQSLSQKTSQTPVIITVTFKSGYLENDFILMNSKNGFN